MKNLMNEHYHFLSIIIRKMNIPNSRWASPQGTKNVIGEQRGKFKESSFVGAERHMERTRALVSIRNIKIMPIR